MELPDLEILLDDDCLLAINKPAGLPTQAPRQYDSLERRVREALPGVTDPRGAYLGLPHRLDRAASGVILLAKTPRAARQLSRQLERRLVKKLYWACLSGTVKPPEGTWTDYLRKLPDQAHVEVVHYTPTPAAEMSHLEAASLEVVTAENAGVDSCGAVQLSVLHYRTLGSSLHGSWLEVELVTGRTHQVRVQAASRGYPLLGDAQYGSTVLFGDAETAGDAEESRQRPIALHARSITFVHPTTQAEVTVTAEVPGDWRSLGLVE